MALIPLKREAYGKAAKKHDARLTYRKKVNVKVYNTDKYGRTVSVVFVDVNESLIDNGYAWQYRKYCKTSFCSDWLQLENQVQMSKLGLWKDSDPVPPWQWRKGARNSS